MVLPPAYGQTLQEVEAAEQESSPRSSFMSLQRTLLTRKQYIHLSILCGRQAGPPHLPAVLECERAGQTHVALVAQSGFPPEVEEVCWQLLLVGKLCLKCTLPPSSAQHRILRHVPSSTPGQHPTQRVTQSSMDCCSDSEVSKGLGVTGSGVLHLVSSTRFLPFVLHPLSCGVLARLFSVRALLYLRLGVVDPRASR